jgi:hypothetical protein
MDAEPAAGFDSKLVLRRVPVRAHQDPKIAAGFFPKQVLPISRGVLINVPQQ